MKNCVKCNTSLDSNRKKFCNSHCKYWYNLIKKENGDQSRELKESNYILIHPKK